MEVSAEAVVPTRVAVERPSAPSRLRVRNGLLSWLVPDLALVAAIAIIGFVLLSGPTTLFRDSDTGWHIRNGESILATGALAHNDPYSFSMAGSPWVAWEWGADLTMGLAHRAAGLGGVATLYTLAIGAVVWMWFRLNWAAGGNFLIACLFAAPMVSTTSLHWLARPHVLSWLFLLGTVWFCERMPARLEARHLAFVVAFSAAWANVHGSFFFASLICLVYAAGDWLRFVIWPEPVQGSVGKWQSYLIVTAAASFGTLFNPSGWGLHRHVVSYLFNSDLLDRVAEFQSFNFHSEGALQVILGLLIAFAGAFAALAARRPDRFVLSLLLLPLALTSARALPVAALLLLPLANGSITAVLSHARDLRPALRRGLDAALDYGANLRLIDRRVHGLALLPLVVLATFVPATFAPLRARAAFPAKTFPVEAAASVAALPADARLFAPDLYGGYLIYRFQGDRKVFFDGRSDFYGADFMKRYIRMIQARPGWRTEFNRWNFTHALLPVDNALAAALATEGWTELHRDKTAVLLSRGSR